MKKHDQEMVKQTTRAEWKRIEARLLRELAVQCRAPEIGHWLPTDIADQLDLEAERREHPEKFAPALRLPMYHPDDVSPVTEPVAKRPTYDELKNVILGYLDWTTDEGLGVGLEHVEAIGARLRATT